MSFVVQDFIDQRDNLKLPREPTRPAPPRGGGATSAHYRHYAEELEKYESRMDTYRELQAKFADRCNEVDEAFKRAALADLGLTDHPKADKLWTLAWEYGHSAGYQEIWNYAQEFAELLTD